MNAAALRVVVTRPAAQAADWVAELQARRIAAVALPLITIEPMADTAPVAAAWRALPRLAVFVSANAVQHFFAQRPAGMPWPDATLAASPGPGTTHALREAGVPAHRIVEPAADAAQFDSEALWAQLQHQRVEWRGADVLIVRGEDGGREWLAETLRDQGARVVPLAAYRRRAPRLDDAGRAILAAARADPRGHLWLFSSSEAIDHLEALAPADAWMQAHAIATHPRIAARARRAGFARVSESRPALSAVIACIQSIRP